MATPKNQAPNRTSKSRFVADTIFDALAAAILTGEYPTGSALPSESALADTHQSSRLLIRQAIHRLARIGLVVSRQGGKTLVQDPASCDHPEVGVLLLRFAANRSEMFTQLRQRQMSASVGVLILAQLNITPQDIEHLEAILNAADPLSIDSFQFKFWNALADISNNTFFQRDTRYWFKVSRALRHVERKQEASGEMRLVIFRAIVEDFKAGRPAWKNYLPLVEQMLNAMGPPENPSDPSN